MIRTVVLTVLACGLAACAAPENYSWNKPGGSLVELQQAQYECERDTRMSAPSFGGGWTGAAAADGFAQRCMNAKGWYLGPASSSSAYRALAPLVDASGKTYQDTDQVLCQFPNATTNFPARTCVEGYGRILGPFRG